MELDLVSSEIIKSLKDIKNKETIIKLIKKIDKDQLIKLFNILNYHYHNLGISLISDFQFDVLDEYIDKDDDGIKYYDIDIDIEDDKDDNNYLSPVELPYPMPSLKKFYPDDKKKLETKLNNFNNIIISSKLDGVSCLLVIKKKKISLYTKGDGIKGRNITHLLEKINFDLSKLKNEKKLILRGELIVKKEHYFKFPTEKILRSQITGLINQKPDKKNDLFSYIDIVFYRVIEPKFNFIDQFKLLQNLNLNTPIHMIYNKEDLNLKKLEDIYLDLIKREKYNIDGLVISNAEYKLLNGNNPDYTFSFKINTYFAETKVTDITWKLSKDSKYIPVINIEPVLLNNNLIKKISGYNASFIINKGLGIDSVIEIKYGGNVIPILNIVKKESDNFMLPENGIWDKHKTHLTFNNYHIDIVAKNIYKFYAVYEIKQLAEKSIISIIQKLETYTKIKIKDIIDYIEALNIWLNNPINILGVKKDKFIIESASVFKNKKISISSFLAASNKFSLMNKIKIDNIINSYPTIIDILVGDNSIIFKEEEKIIDELIKIQGIDMITAENFIKGIIHFLERKDEYNKLFYIDYELCLKKNYLKVVMSNIKKKNEIVSSYSDLITLKLDVTKNDIDYLVVNNVNDSTTKIQKARKYKIPIITLDEFYEIINNRKKNRITE